MVDNDHLDPFDKCEQVQLAQENKFHHNLFGTSLNMCLVHSGGNSFIEVLLKKITNEDALKMNHKRFFLVYLSNSQLFA